MSMKQVAKSSALKKEATCFSETVNFQRTTPVISQKTELYTTVLIKARDWFKF
jgi:hypothetical protein